MSARVVFFFFKQLLTHLIVFVLLVHAPFAFGLCDDLTSVLHDDLVGLKASIASHTVATINSLDNLNANAKSTAFLGSRSQLLESAIVTIFFANIAVGFIALIQHDAVLAVLSTTILRLANALGLIILEMISLSPVRPSVSDEAIWEILVSAQTTILDIDLGLLTFCHLAPLIRFWLTRWKRVAHIVWQLEVPTINQESQAGKHGQGEGLVDLAAWRKFR